MLADRTAAKVGQLCRQLHDDRFGTPHASAMRREQSGIDPVMARNRLINLVQRYRPPRQIEVFILQAASPALLDPLLGPVDWRSSLLWKRSARPLPRLVT